jgi:hypothetical protein
VHATPPGLIVARVASVVGEGFDHEPIDSAEDCAKAGADRGGDHSGDGVDQLLDERRCARSGEVAHALGHLDPSISSGVDASGAAPRGFERVRRGRRGQGEGGRRGQQNTFHVRYSQLCATWRQVDVEELEQLHRIV